MVTHKYVGMSHTRRLSSRWAPCMSDTEEHLVSVPAGFGQYQVQGQFQTRRDRQTSMSVPVTDVQKVSTGVI